MTLVATQAMGPLARGEALRLHIGTYTGKTGAKGIYTCVLDPARGTLTEPLLAAECENASWLTWNHDHTRLYAVNEIGTPNGGSVSTYGADPRTGGLDLLGRTPSGGSAPCHLSLVNEGRLLLVAHYCSGNISALALDGQALPATPPQRFPHLPPEGTPAHARAHAHAIEPSPDGRFALAADLGLDEIIPYRLTSGNRSLERAEAPPCVLPAGTGPRHLVFHPRLPFLYTVNELSNTVTRYAYDRLTGRCQPLQTLSSLPTGSAGTSATSEIQIDAEGRTLYVANRGHDSLTAYTIDTRTGALSWLQNQESGGHWPRYFALVPGGRWLLVANERSGSLAILEVDPSSGRLGKPQGSVAIAAPACFVFSDATPHLFIGR